MRLVSTAEARADSFGQLVARQQARGPDDSALAMHPLGLDRIEPRALARQVAHEDAHALACPLDL